MITRANIYLEFSKRPDAALFNQQWSHFTDEETEALSETFWKSSLLRIHLVRGGT